LSTKDKRPSGLAGIKIILRRLLTAAGYSYSREQWARVVYYKEWERFLFSLPIASLSSLEISPGTRTIWKDMGFGSYRAAQYPEFDITKERLSECFDIIIADQVFEHVRYPDRAARNVRAMLKPGGTFLIATPFLVKIHPTPHDYTRWTAEGLGALLEDCGFTADVRTWGNRKAISANFDTWCDYGWKRDLSNEADLPLVVWAYARRA
jgi:SAM-dependent methyltransferase